MLKKKLKTVLLTALALSVTLTGCKAGGPGKNSSEATKVDKYKSESYAFSLEEEEEESQKTEEAVDGYWQTRTQPTMSPNPYTVPDRRITMDVPNYASVDTEHMKLFDLPYDRFAAVIVDKEAQAEDMHEAYDITMKHFMEEIKDTYKVNDIKVWWEDDQDLRGVPIYCFEGELDYTSANDVNYPAYCLGFSFILDGTPCTIMGAVISRAQYEQDIIELHDMVITMMNTLH